MPSSRITLAFLLVLFGSSALADPGSCLPGRGCRDEPNWLDRSHSALSERTERLASSLDRFFGVDDSAEEAARSFLRVRVSGGYDHFDGGDGKLSIKGQWHLPRIDERVGLVFDDGEESTDSTISDDSGSSVGLRFEQKQRKRRGRFGLRATFRSGAKLRTELRYRYDPPPFKQSIRSRTFSTVWWQDGRGEGITLGGSLEKSLSSRQLVRYAARIEWAEDFEGRRWQQTIALNSRLSLKDATAVFARFSGETYPFSFTQSAAFGVLYRRQVFRQWMFAEIEPVFDWRRVDADAERKFAPSLTLRIEWQLGDPVQLW